jgi:hypothetical protein
MKIRIQKNFDSKTKEDLFGISIMPEGSVRYCKYPVGHQKYKTKEEAEQARDKVKEILDNGGEIVYSPKGSAGKNRHEYVIIKQCDDLPDITWDKPITRI